ncbi:UDP-Glycosyltransferase superfamily protein [Actinidia rufa]|uniref:UDP-Glycosyltransferase superfamily protein n=1 Tax=Actinidia rufa TaxID=165716 RepID=A0A7J0FW47_9ERIC|nr:UDP-Glycosyltransferase superfamily protein [Actinidia rufa]
MAKPLAAWSQKRWLFPLLVALSLSTALVFLLRAAFDSSCDRHTFVVPDMRFDSDRTAGAGTGLADWNPLGFMKSKRVLLVSHELSLSGNVTVARNLNSKFFGKK